MGDFMAFSVLIIIMAPIFLVYAMVAGWLLVSSLRLLADWYSHWKDRP